MAGFKHWFQKITLGQPQHAAKLAAWMFFDNYIAAIPHAVMLMAVYLLFGPVIDPNMPIPVKAILLLCGLLILQSILYYFVARKSYIIACAGFAGVTRKSRLATGEHLRRLPMGFYNRRSAGDLTTVLLRDYETVEANCNSLMPTAAVIAARLSMALIVLTVFDWRMMLATIAVIPLAIPLAVLSYRLLSRKNTDLLEAQQENTARILEYAGGIQTLKAFNQSDEMYRRLRASCDELRKTCLAVEGASAPMAMLAKAILNGGTAVVMALGLFLLLGGSLAPLTLVVFLLLALNIYNPMMSLLMMLVNITRLNHCAQRIVEVMEEKPLPFEEKAAAPEHMAIRFDQVSFGYGKNQVLHDVSFDIPARSLTALVGPSGSGKSTITRLIARFWDVDSGFVSIGGVPVSNQNPDILLRNISMVFQDVYLFHDTIENNIRMGREDADREEVMAAAKLAACHDFITALPQGYQTMVGEGGSTLSGGEKQRISIARALLKDAPIVLLDEATASLDPENEVFIQQAIDALVENKTVVVIAHRLRSVQNADQIIVLNEGRLAEIGDHESLLAQNGLYRRMWEEQQKAGNWRLALSAALTNTDHYGILFL
ncbi:MAG: ABC transporter ATP-binding protein [Clostridiales bacterium]